MNNEFEKLNLENIKTFSNQLSQMSPTEYIITGCIIAIILSQLIDPNEQNTFGNFLEMVGQILLTSYAKNTVTNPDYISFSQKDAEQLKKELFQFIHKINITNKY